jgi:hypothetical protein
LDWTTIGVEGAVLADPFGEPPLIDTALPLPLPLPPAPVALAPAIRSSHSTLCAGFPLLPPAVTFGIDGLGSRMECRESGVCELGVGGSIVIVYAPSSAWVVVVEIGCNERDAPSSSSPSIRSFTFKVSRFSFLSVSFSSFVSVSVCVVVS